MDPASAHKRAVIAAFGRLPLEHPVFQGGRTCRAFRSRMSGEWEFTETGDRSGYSFTLRILRDELTGELPRPGDICTVAGKRCRVLNPVEVDSMDVSVLLHLAGESGHVN